MAVCLGGRGVARNVCPRIHAHIRKIKAAVLILVTAAIAAGQAPQKAPASPRENKVDTWERSKECAAQAEKLFNEITKKAIAAGLSSGPDDWRNHYSPKYGKCFLEVDVFTHYQSPSGGGLLVGRSLRDAFERTILAEAEAGSELATSRIGSETATTEKAAAFIDEHMKN
jgi:hypothetical protein